MSAKAPAEKKGQSFRASNGAQFIFNFNFQTSDSSSASDQSAGSSVPQKPVNVKSSGPTFCFNFNNIPPSAASLLPQMMAFASTHSESASFEGPDQGQGAKASAPAKRQSSEALQRLTTSPSGIFEFEAASI
jgi:hypothetical protein